MRLVRAIQPLAFLVVAGCVPNGPPTSDAGTAGAPAPAKTHPAPLIAHPLGEAGAISPPSVPLGAGFEDAFDRTAIGPNWDLTGEFWRIENGRLCGKNAHNHPIWLARQLPVNVRIEFDAVTYSEDGDLKAEFFADGHSAASGNTYNDATGYLTIFGGWKNQFHVLARLNEHASDRPEIKIEPGSDDERARPVVSGQPYHFKVERPDGRTVIWSIGNTIMFRFTDPQPLTGTGHDHFGFNDWEVPVCFDNVSIVPI
jgi:hypothetical protein